MRPGSGAFFLTFVRHHRPLSSPFPATTMTTGGLSWGTWELSWAAWENPSAATTPRKASAISASTFNFPCAAHRDPGVVGNLEAALGNGSLKSIGAWIERGSRAVVHLTEHPAGVAVLPVAHPGHNEATQGIAGDRGLALSARRVRVDGSHHYQVNGCVFYGWRTRLNLRIFLPCRGKSRLANARGSECQPDT